MQPNMHTEPARLQIPRTGAGSEDSPLTVDQALTRMLRSRVARKELHEWSVENRNLHRSRSQVLSAYAGNKWVPARTASVSLTRGGHDIPQSHAPSRPRSHSVSASLMDNQHDYPPDAHLPPTPPRQYLKQYSDPANYPDPAHFPSPPSYPPVPPLVPSGSSSTSTRSSAYASPGPPAALSSNDLSTLIGRYAPDHDPDVYDDSIGAAITTDKAVPPAVSRSLSHTRLVLPTDPTPPPPTIGWSDPYTPSNHSPGSSYDGSPEPASVRSMPYAPQGLPEHNQQSPIIDDDPPLARRRPPIRTSSSHSASFSGLTSEDDTDADQDPEQDSFDFENARTAAVVVAEEGRGLIVQGVGLGVSALNIQSGTTHLLLSSLATPNSLPTLLTNTLPAISATLLALDVSANYLSALPPALASCTRLTELNVASNPLRALPVWLSRLTELRVLIADATGISTLPVELGTLRALNILSLRRNRLMSLPAWLANLPGLEHLSIEGNPFQGPWQALLAPLTDRPNFPTPITSPYSGSHTNSTYATNSMYSASTPTSLYVPPSTASLPTDEPPSSANRYEEEDHTIVPGRGQLSTKPPTSTAPVAPGSRSSQNSPGMLTAGSPSMLPYMRTTPPNISSEYASFSTAHARSASPLLRTRTTPGRPNTAVINRLSESASILTERGGVRPRSSTSSDAQRPHTDFVRRVDDSGYYDSRRSDGSEFFGGTMEEEEDQHKKALRRMRSADELRRALESVIGPSEPTHVEEDAGKKIPAPSKDVQPFVARLESGTARHTVAPPESPGPRRFATMQTIPTRPRTRPSLSDAVWDAEDEADDPAPKSAKQGKWGFLKKMSMGRMRPEPSPPANTGASKFARRMEMSSPPRSEPQIPTIQNSSPRPGGRAPSQSQSPALPTPPASATLLGPPQPRSAKRRSFLPLDGPPMLNIPIPKTDTGALLAESIIATNDDAQAPSEAPAHPSSQVPARSSSETRALKSVMAYLRDMADLGMAPAPPDGARVTSEGFSTGSGSVGTRSDDQRAKTMSVMTTDSSGSGGREEDRSRHKDDKTKRGRIVKEIIETERTYVKGLQELIEIYVKPASQSVNTLGNAVAATKETVVPAQERKIVFNGLDSLLSFHKQSFLPSLERAALARGPGTDGESEGDHSLAAAQAIANVFLSHAAFMRMYSSYINNFDNAVNRLKQWTTERRPTTASPGSSLVSPNSSTVHLVGMGLQMSIPGGGVGESQPTGGMAPLSASQRRRIKSYLKRCRMNPQHSQLNLEGYLLLPVQRIPRYRLMLEELVRCTSPTVDAYDDPLDRALTEITSLANNMNEGKRESESRRRLVQWQSRIRGKFPSPLVQPHRRLIMDGGLHLTRVVRKSAMAFDVVNPAGEVSNIQVECLAPEETPRSLVGILCNDLLVLCKDPSTGKDHTSQVDLWAVLRMQTLPQPASIVHGSALRVVDNKAILYFNAPSTSDALTWCRAINMHVPASKS